MVKIARILFLTALSLTMVGCANRGVGPQGGPKDSLPPVMVREEPLNGTLRFKGDKVQIYFNEYIQLTNVSENVLISPPMPHQPEVKAVGKHVQVSFQDSLAPNSTYTIDFGSAICDFREKNPLEGYTFAFSTGDQIDSLEAYGQVFYAEDLNPVYGAVVGIQENLEDSAFGTVQFTRIAKTDSSGYFSIHNIREGEYRYYALMDMDKSYTYQPGEALAFTDDTIHPFLYEEIRYDTIYTHAYDTIYLLDSEPMNDEPSYRIDTTTTISHIDTLLDTYAEPGNLVLILFREDKQRHYFLRPNREERHCITLPFSAAQDSMPLLEATWLDSALIEASAHYDTLTLWLADSTLLMRDTLELKMTYLKSDSLYNLVPQTDTLLLNYREPRLTEHARQARERKAAERRLVAKSNASATFQVYDTLCLTFDYPVATIDTPAIRLYEKIDTSFVERTSTLVAKNGSSRVYQVLAKLEPEHMYELRLDSAAATDIYGRCCLSSKHAVTVKSLATYSSIRVDIPHAHGNEIIQLLDEKDKVIRSLSLFGSESQEKNGIRSVLFNYLEMKACYLRLYLDLNGDGRWTTGDWAKKRQPEPVYYFPKKLNLKANWDFEETFDYTARPQLESKPSALIKPYSGEKKK